MTQTQQQFILEHSEAVLQTKDGLTMIVPHSHENHRGFRHIFSEDGKFYERIYLLSGCDETGRGIYTETETKESK